MTRASSVLSGAAIIGWMAAMAGILAPNLAQAQETTTYTYDANGRVTQVTRSGGPVSGTVSSYNYDTVDNRSSVAVTGSPNGSGNGSGSGASVPVHYYIVVPLNGYTVISFQK